MADDVKKWVDGLFSSKSGEKRIVGISDMYMPDAESEAGLSASYNYFNWRSGILLER